MHAFGCHIVNQAAETEEGFESIVHRGNEIRGPFEKIEDALKCARQWNAESGPVPEPVVEETPEPQE